MKSIRSNPTGDARRGDERIRTAVRWLGAVLAYVRHGGRLPWDDICIASLIRERNANDTGDRITLEQLREQVTLLTGTEA